MLQLNNIVYRIAGRTIFDQANVSVNQGERVGLIGLNGTGKSTLFKLINHQLELDSGEIVMAAGLKIGTIEQELPNESMSLMDVVLSADKERTALLNEIETTTDMQRMADIYERLEDISAYDAPARASVILKGLGFEHEAQERPIGDFSGGWRMRVALAAALFSQPDLLLLDEPTNHLDFEAMIWLEDYLKNYPKTLIIISHDRQMLNKTVTHIIHLDQLCLTKYTGNYDTFELLLAQKQLNQQALFEKQQAFKARTMAFVNRFGAKATKARQAQSRLRALEKMDMVEAIISSRSTQFHFPQPEVLASPLISVDHVAVGYNASRPVLKNVQLSIGQEDRIVLLGANGNGKSTLIKLIAGQLQPMAGEMVQSNKLNVGYFAQHQTDELDVESTAYLTLQHVMKGTPEPKIRALLGRFGFNKAKADTKIAQLSGGEKARLLFCLMSYNAPQIMLLDEPTNHLDMDARAALIQALNEYEGCIILVTHDPYLVEAVADQLWLVHEQTVEPFDGSLEDYQALVIEQRKKERANSKKSKKNNSKEKESGSKKNVNPMILKEVEEQLAQLSMKKQELEQAISAIDGSNDTHALQQLVEQYAAIEQQLKTTEEQWIQLHESDSE